MKREFFVEQLQQAFVEPFQAHHGAVIQLHELLYRQVVFLVFKSEALGNLPLIIEQQPVFSPACEQV